jgi:hypothetical protein
LFFHSKALTGQNHNGKNYAKQKNLHKQPSNHLSDITKKSFPELFDILKTTLLQGGAF